MDGLYQGILDREELQRIQDEFCMVAGVYAFCVDSAGKDVTYMSGEKQDRERLDELASKEKLLSLFWRISQSSLEDQAIEETEVDALKYAAVCVKVADQTVLTWLVCVVLSDAGTPEGREFSEAFSYRTTEKQFNLALDLLREISRHIVGDKILAENARAESSRERCFKNEMEGRFRRADATARIVQMLGSDAPIEDVLSGFLATVGGILGIDCAYLCSVDNMDREHMDVIAAWRREGICQGDGQTGKQLRPAYLCREKPVVLSSASGTEGYATELDRAGIKALAAFPISLKDKVGMYACFEARHCAHNWEVEEIRFLSDSVKTLAKRMRKNTVEGSCALLKDMLYSVGSAVYVRDKKSGEILFSNGRFKDEFGEKTQQDTLADIFEDRIPKNADSGSIEICMEEQGNWYDFFYRNVTWADGREMLMCSIYDITEKKMYERKLKRQVYTDYLTGLCNRMCCERDLTKYVEEAKKAGKEGALLYLDLDDFKYINDSLGHQYGDVLLKSIAHGMRNVSGIHDFCYRMGGDEFAVLIPCDRFGILEQVVREIRSIFERPWFIKDADYYCTMSMGIVHFPSEGEEVQELVKKADIAMYEAKKLGKNCVAVYDDSIQFDSGKRLALEKKLRDAAMDGYKEFEVHYQPIVDIQRGSVCTGAEALIRWNSGEMGFMSPADFIPLAEYLGLINPIGNHVLQQACEACKRWNDNGHPDYKVNVNLSVVQLRQKGIVKTISRIVKKSKINPHNLTLEVTEGMAVQDLECMKKLLQQIKKLGVRIALDDFGTGYSSLGHVKELPFDVIKVDQSFVRDLAEDTYSKSFVKMVSDLADALGVSICMEGVETEEQCKVLGDMNVRLIQGYYFDRPMPAGEFEKKYVV